MSHDQQTDTEASGCCGGPAPEGTDACCVKDADAKAAGQDGCGCNSTTTRKTDEANSPSSNTCCG